MSLVPSFALPSPIALFRNDPRISFRTPQSKKKGQYFSLSLSRKCKLRSNDTVFCSMKTNWASLSSSDFGILLKSCSMPICFVGMSNCGKSHWSRQLKEHLNFSLHSVDECIEAAIEPELTQLGYSGIDGLASWMGFPFDEQFQRNQARYLELEEKLTADAPCSPGNIVLDTTGSVCYLTSKTLERIKRDFLVVHLEASDGMMEQLSDAYFSTPKPVVWGDMFEQAEGEPPEQALRRCYPKLLQWRRERYADIAHIAIPTEISLSRNVRIHEFVELLHEKLSLATESMAPFYEN